MYALIDCNNFYVSCERVFNPAIRDIPVAVLSNNDGCLVARSNEVKAAGIPMGAPYFKYRDVLKNMGAVVFSSNYELYGDMSRRVIHVLCEFSSNIEVYSIDEAFMSFPDWSDHQLYELGRAIRASVHQQVGIPVSIGFARTKTLTKVASERAKKDLWRSGVCVLTERSEIDQVLARFPIEDIWGVGRKYTQLLNTHGVCSAQDFVDLEPHWIKKKMTVMGLRTWQELQGRSCEGLQEHIPAKKAIASTRSFGRVITEKSEIKEAIAQYVTRGSKKLRKQSSVAHYLHVFVMTSRFRDNAYYRSVGMRLGQGTSYTPDILRAAYVLLDKVFVPGKDYKKAGILLSGLTPDNVIQQPLFGHEHDIERQARAMNAIDSIHARFGNSAIAIGSMGLRQTTARWAMNADYRSRRYTTKWDEILTVPTGC